MNPPFSKKLRIIVTLRQFVDGLYGENATILNSLDIGDLQSYIRAHPRGGGLAKRIDRIEDVFRHTGGLPTAVDRLIVNAEYVDLDRILDEDASIDATPDSETAPQSLVSAVSTVFAAQDEAGYRRLALLKLLTVLKDGETLDSIRNIYKGKPFYESHVVSLAELALLEVLPVEQAAAGIITSRAQRSTLTNTQKLLRVQRQVRDHVSKLITPDERSRIYNAVSSSMFGEKWFEGKFKLRRSIIIAYRQSSIAGPANELLVAQFLLRAAIDRNNLEKVDRYARLAVGYCGQLVKEDRYRDAVIACRAILRILNSDDYGMQWQNCSYLYGRSLRMVGQFSEAIDVLKRTLSESINAPQSFLALINLNLALSYDSIADKEAAKAHAEKVAELSEENDGNWIQAAALVAEIELTGAKLEVFLRNLRSLAYRHKHLIAAGNISLQLSRIVKCKKEAIRLIDSVLSDAKDLYSQARAVVEKAKMLRTSGQLLELTKGDEACLCAAYEYSCCQRLTSMMNSCHDSLWEYCTLKSLWDGLLRIFRFSSFVWRLTNRGNREGEFIPKLIEAKESKVFEKFQEIEVEVEYLDNRLAEIGT